MIVGVKDTDSTYVIAPTNARVLVGTLFYSYARRYRTHTVLGTVVITEW